jgi:hypothetical protein
MVPIYNETIVYMGRDILLGIHSKWTSNGSANFDTSCKHRHCPITWALIFEKEEGKENWEYQLRGEDGD